MKNFKTAISLTLMATLGGTLLAPTPTNAEWVQNPIGVPRAPGCDPGYSWQKIGVRYQCVTPQPTCAYGFASGPVWTGTAWNYSCNVPPAPSCPSGYDQAAAPSWNGSAWVGQQCTPRAQTQTPSDPEAICAAHASASPPVGIKMGPLTRKLKFNSYAGPATQYYHDNSPGPYWEVGGQSGTNWVVMCAFVNATGDWVPQANQPYYVTPNIPYTDPGGG